jgi:hypothetical protein
VIRAVQRAAKEKVAAEMRPAELEKLDVVLA